MEFPPNTTTAPTSEHGPALAERPEITVWYLSGLQRCNFRCRYCASGQPALQRGTAVATWVPSGPETHEAVVAWIAAQPFRIRLRVNSIGEPFVSKAYMESIARLTHASNLSFVEILSNGSFRPAQFDQIIERCQPSKLSLWLTFHHEFISPAALVAAAAHARARGAFVVVNALVFPDNLPLVTELIRLCQDRELRFVTGTGLNFNGAYPTRHLLAIEGLVPELREKARALAETHNPLGEFHALAAESLGKPCAAGGDYFFITPQGDVYPCLAYSFGAPQTKLGSVLDARLRLARRKERYAPCRSRTPCGCVEDYQNLEATKEAFSWTDPSLCLPVRNLTR